MPKRVCRPILFYIMPVMDGDHQEDEPLSEKKNLVKLVGKRRESANALLRVGA